MHKLKDPKVQGALRHLLTALGPVLFLFMAAPDPVALLRTLISAAGWPSLVGLLMAVLGFWQSWTAREKR